MELGLPVTPMHTTQELQCLPVTELRFRVRLDACYEVSVARVLTVRTGTKRQRTQVLHTALEPPVIWTMMLQMRMMTKRTRMISTHAARWPHALRSRAHLRALQQAIRRLLPPQPLSMELDSLAMLTHTTQELQCLPVMGLRFRVRLDACYEVSVGQILLVRPDTKVAPHRAANSAARTGQQQLETRVLQAPNYSVG